MANYRALPLLIGKPVLNFNIIGSLTQPVNPRENTIWIETETPVHYWSLSGHEPALSQVEDTQIIVDVGGSPGGDDANGIYWITDFISIASNTLFKVSCENLNEQGFIISYYDNEDVLIDSRDSYENTFEDITPAECSKITISSYGVENRREFDEQNWTLTLYSEVLTFSSGKIVQSGDVWIKTLNKQGVVSFNALKKNIIDTQLDKVYQWSGSEWALVDAYIYQDGIFTSVYKSEYIIFDGGMACDYTGGWNMEDRGAEPSIGTTINLPSSSRVCMKEPIPSGYTTLHVTCTSGGGYGTDKTCACNIKTGPSTSSDNKIEWVVNEGDNAFDITDMSGHVSFFGYYMSFTVSKVWLT